MNLRPVAAGLGLALLGFAAVPLGLNAWQARSAQQAQRADAARHAEAATAAGADADLERAVVAWRVAATLAPDHAPYRAALLQARARLVAEQPETVGRAEGAAELIHELRLAADGGDLDPAGAALHRLAVGVLEQARGRADRAMAAYDEALVADAASALAWHRKGLLLMAQGKTEEAELPLRRATELGPKDWRFHRALGACQAARGDWARAALSEQAAVDLDRRFETLRALGTARLKLEQFDPAVEALDQARRLAPTVQASAAAGLSGELGYALFRANRVREALPYLQAAVEAERTAEHLFQLGVALAQVEAHEQAAARFEEAIGLDRMHDAAHERLVVSLVKSGQVGVAKAAVARFLKLAGDDTRFAGRTAEMRRLQAEIDGLLGVTTGPVALPPR